MSTFITEFGGGAKIIIPSIQRDYVQPLNKSIIKGFVKVLIDAYARKIDAHTENKVKDLNYLYGITDADGNFVPIDGQQRLTTLWLLHLYVAARSGAKLEAAIEYQTRDISGDFCNALSRNLASLNFDMKRLSDEIKDARWFIGCWEESVTVKSILIALDVIHNIFVEGKPDMESMWGNMNAGEDSPVRFAFHNPQDLGKDIYVKMNSRGKALTQFENLKAWFDDRLKILCKRHDSHLFSDWFYKDWRVKMDNDWTDLFWRNRNVNAAFPEEIDDSQLRLFFTMAYVVWAQKGAKRRRLMNVHDSKFDANSILTRMRKSLVEIPVYELNRLDIFNEEVFLFAHKAMNGLIKLESVLNNGIQAVTEEEKYSKVYFWKLADKPLKFIYQLLLSETGKEIAYPKMALAASLLYFAHEDINGDELLNWMRFSRNIVNNISISEENIHNILSALRKWARQLKHKGWDNFIRELQSPIRSSEVQMQIDEEKAKSHWLNLHPECSMNLYRLENHRFFFGRISYLMQLFQSMKSENTIEAGNLFNCYAQMLFKLFDNDGPNRDLNGKDLRSAYIFHRAVLALSEYYGYGVKPGSNWILSDSKDDWKKYLEDFRCDDDNNSHNIGITRLLSELRHCKEEEYFDKLKQIISVKKAEISDWRQDLVCYQNLWKYMNDKNVRFDGQYKIFLLKGKTLGERNRRSELRSRGLYAFLKNEVFTEGKDHGARIPLNNWTLDFWDWYESKRRNSYLYFKKSIDENVIFVYVFFDTTQNKEDAYCIEIFDQKGEKKKSREISEHSLRPFESILNKYDFVWTDYYAGKQNLSRTAATEFLKEFIPYSAT